MPDQLDLIRRFFTGLNRGDADGLRGFYDPGCVAEHVFVDDQGVVEGRAAVIAGWQREFSRYAGALAGGHRVEVTRVAGIETGWGWVRSEWFSALRSEEDALPRYFSGHSHFWVEDGAIRRHRSVKREVAAPARGDAARSGPSASTRRYPSRPIVGVGAVVFDADGRVVLVKRRQEPLAGQWSLPGGTLELGETLEAGAAREMVEETGLIVDVGPVVEVFDRILVDEDGRVQFHFVLVDFLCKARGGTLRAGSDVSDARSVAPEELGAHRLTEKAADVIERARALRAGLSGRGATTSQSSIDNGPGAS